MEIHWDFILQIVAPMAGFFAWTWNRIDKKFETIEKKFDDKIGRIEQRLDRIEQRVDRIESKVDGLTDRVGRLEGAFYERGYWESRKTGSDKSE